MKVHLTSPLTVVHGQLVAVPDEAADQVPVEVLGPGYVQHLRAAVHRVQRRVAVLGELWAVGWAAYCL